jgi:hypothetical protein
VKALKGWRSARVGQTVTLSNWTKRQSRKFLWLTASLVAISDSGSSLLCISAIARSGSESPSGQKGRFGNRPSLCSYAEMDMTGEPIALRTRRTYD